MTMKNDDAEKRPAKAINHLDGKVFGVTELVLAMLRSLPIEQQAKVLTEFGTHSEVAKAGMLNSGVSDDLIDCFLEYVKDIKKIYGEEN
jgi:hypothetical protein